MQSCTQNGKLNRVNKLEIYFQRSWKKAQVSLHITFSSIPCYASVLWRCKKHVIHKVNSYVIKQLQKKSVKLLKERVHENDACSKNEVCKS